LSAKQVNDLYEVRKALESLAVRLAVPRLTDVQVAELRAILADVHAAYERQDMIAYGEADRRFHNTIAAYSGNETLIESLDRLGLQIQLVRTAANHDPGVVERAARARPEIVAALEARDVRRAVRLMAAHIEDVRRSVVAQIERESSGIKESGEGRRT
jgi:DNA-binding GntR family transcriptional regulator